MIKRRGGNDDRHDMPAAIEKLRDAAFRTAIDPEMEATMLAGAKARLAEIASEEGGKGLAQRAVPGGGGQPRVFISYSHDSAEHKDLVRQFATFLRTQGGIDARLDQWADGQRRDWSLWAIDQLREADFVLVVASPDYKRRAEGMEAPDVGRGTQFEAAMIRDYYQTRVLPPDMRRFLPIVLPGRSVDEIPAFLNTHSTTSYEIKEFTLEGTRHLLTALIGVPLAAMPKRGDWFDARRHAAPRSRPLTTLQPARRGSDIQMTGAEIGGMHHSNSIVFRPALFANEPRGVVEYNLGRRYRRFEAVAGVLDDADEADQVGCFQVFLDGVPQERFEAKIGKPIWIQHDVSDVLRLTLVAWRPGTVANPLHAGAQIAGGRSATLPSLAWGDPALVE